jgi:hypothetical protein
MVVNKSMQSDTYNQLQEAQSPDDAATSQEEPAAKGPAVWTPPFILFFALYTGLGLSIAALLTFIWLNSGMYSPAHLFMFYGGLTFLCWLLVIVRGRLLWTRIGGIAGCLWALFIAIEYWLISHGISSQSNTFMQIHLITGSALLAASLCLSYARTRVNRWDTQLSWLIPLCICAYLAFSYVRAPAGIPKILYLEGRLVTLSLLLCVIVWWLRPANWATQPGLTFFFGVIALLQYYLDRSAQFYNENTLLFQQIVFLGVMLSTFRIYQAEKQLSTSEPKPQETQQPEEVEVA